MKRIKTFLIILMALLLSGCVKYELKMGVNTDKSITITLISAVQKDYYTEDDGETKRTYEQKGFKVTEYEDDAFKGYKLSKKFDSIDRISQDDCSQVEITQLLSMDLDNLVLFKKNKTNTITTYTADFTYNLALEGQQNNQTDYSEQMKNMSFQYTISLPHNSKIISENADTKTNDGYTLNWDVKYGELKNIDFVFLIDDKEITPPVVDEEQNDIIVNDEEKNPSEEMKNDIEEIDTTTSNSNNENVEKLSFKDIILTIITIGIVIGLFYIKFKTRKGVTIKSNQKYHSVPRK